MTIDNRTLAIIKAILCEDDIKPLCGSEAECGPVWQLGRNYLIRTVTMINSGRLAAVTPQELVLVDAAWIADTGRFADAIRTCEFKEVEPFPNGAPVIIGRGAVIDAVQIDKLPRVQK